MNQKIDIEVKKVVTENETYFDLILKNDYINLILESDINISYNLKLFKNLLSCIMKNKDFKYHIYNSYIQYENKILTMCIILSDQYHHMTYTLQFNNYHDAITFIGNIIHKLELVE